MSEPSIYFYPGYRAKQDKQMFTHTAWLVIVVSIGSGLFMSWPFLKEPDLPHIDENRWWGKASTSKDEDTSIQPFKIEFNDTMIADLKHRIKSRRPLTPPLEGTQSEYGINTMYLEKLLAYWTENYDFKKRVDLLNRFPHYMTKIQGLNIHFIRVKPLMKDVKVLPLLMLHGWPSSSKEFDQMIPTLTNPKVGYDFVFETIAADLPGYGYSEGTNKKGLNPVQMSVVLRNLMKRLGFNKFYIHGGGMGAQVATHMATIFPDEILGFHTNTPISTKVKSVIKLLLGSLAPSLAGEYAGRIYPLKKVASYVIRESGYMHIQSTKPDTIGVALTDSPSGLAAYYMEKLAVGSNRDQLDTPHGGLENLKLDDVLDTITIHWVNNCAVTSMRLYTEDYFVSSPEVFTVHGIPTKVPTAAIKFLYEIFWQPDWILRDKFPNLVRSTTIHFGGHYAALEAPQILAEDIYAAGVEFQKFHDANTKIHS